MKKPISLLLFLILSFVLYSQENLILHRLYMEKPVADAALAPDALFFQAPDTLFNLINTRQPVILSSRDESNSRIETEILSVKEGTEVRFTLLRDDAPLLVSVGVFAEDYTYADYLQFLDESVADIVPYLGRVEPRIRLAELKTDNDTRELLNELIYADSLLTPYEATVWAGILSKNPGDSTNSSPILLHFPLHYFGEFSWFPSANHGISASLFVEYSDYMTHADSVLNPDGEGLSDNLYILPGIGYTYRTAGRFSAGFYAGLNVGALQITAREDLTWDGGLNLLDGESEWVLFHYFVMRPFVSYALNESWSIKTSFAVFLSLFQLFPNPLQTDYYNAGDPGGEIQFLNVGVSYRWR